MAAIGLQEPGHEAPGDSRNQFHGVRLEVERVCTEMAELETGPGDEMRELERRLSDRIAGVKRTLRRCAGDQDVRHGGDDCLDMRGRKKCPLSRAGKAGC